MRSNKMITMSGFKTGGGGRGTLARYIQWNLDLTSLYIPKSSV